MKNVKYIKLIRMIVKGWKRLGGGRVVNVGWVDGDKLYFIKHIICELVLENLVLSE